MTEKRACERIPVCLDITFYCCDKLQQGTVKNMSDRGMFISTQQICFPFDSRFQIMIPVTGGELQVTGHLRRIEMIPGTDDGIGVEVVNPPGEYLHLLEDLRAVQ